jgi:hypothetical protein
VHDHQVDLMKAGNTQLQLAREADNQTAHFPRRRPYGGRALGLCSGLPDLGQCLHAGEWRIPVVTITLNRSPHA